MTMQTDATFILWHIDMKRTHHKDESFFVFLFYLHQSIPMLSSRMRFGINFPDMIMIHRRIDLCRRDIGVS